MIRLFLASVVGLGLCLPAPVSAKDWPQFRGPSGSGTTKGANLPTEWSADKNVAWKVKLPGTGLSQPVVVGDKLFVTAAVSDKLRKPKSFGPGVIETGREKLPDVEIDWKVVALDRTTGKTLWAKSATKGKPKYAVHACNSFATETPCADAERVYAYYGATGTVAAFDHAGKEVWKAELGAYPTVANWGSGASPVLGGGKVIVTSFSQESAFVVALDCKTGKEGWRFKWAEKGLTTSWSSPLVWANSKRTELVVCGPDGVSGLALDTGDELWRMSGFQPFTSSPTVDGDTLYISNGGQSSTGPLLGIRAGAGGDITTKEDEKPNEFVAWSVTAGGAGWSSPLAQNGYLYVPGKGTLACYDAKTGKQQYNKRVPKMNRLIASPVATGDQVLVLDEAGAAAVVKAGPAFEVVGTGKLDDSFWASPAVAGGDLYLRGVDHLYCVRQVKSRSPSADKEKTLQEIENLAKGLVLKLGAPVFREREAASRELVNLGPGALKAIKEGLENPDPAIVARCRRLYPKIRTLDLERRIEELAADKEGRIANTLPLGAAYEKICGKDENARKFYIDLCKNNLQLLDDAANNPKTTGEAYIDFFNGIEKRGNGVLPAETEGAALLLAALLLIGADEKIGPSIDEANRNQPKSDRNYQRMIGVLWTPKYEAAINDANNGRYLRKLLFAWAKRLPEPLAITSFTFFIRDMIKKHPTKQLSDPDTLEYLMDLAVSTSAQRKHQKGEAMSMVAVANISKNDRMAFFEGKLFKDETTLLPEVLFDLKGPTKIRVETRVCDYALAICVKLSGQSFKDYGFDILGSRSDMFNSWAYSGFTKDETRKAAFKKYEEWRKVNPIKKDEPKKDKSK